MTAANERLSKREKVIYRTTTSIVCAVMIFSVINFIFNDHFPFPNGPEGAFVHLGLPHYFKIELTTAKILAAGAVDTECPLQNKRVCLFWFWHHVDFGQHRALRTGRCQAQRVVHP
jgi:hypothetical protein